jgi:hypothetical protein
MLETIIERVFSADQPLRESLKIMLVAKDSLDDRKSFVNPSDTQTALYMAVAVNAHKIIPLKRIELVYHLTIELHS